MSKTGTSSNGKVHRFDARRANVAQDHLAESMQRMGELNHELQERLFAVVMFIEGHSPLIQGAHARWAWDQVLRAASGGSPIVLNDRGDWNEFGTSEQYDEFVAERARAGMPWDAGTAP